MGSQSVASSSVPTSGATNVFGGGSTTPSVHHSSKSPLPSSPNIFGCLMQPPPLSLQSRWPPKAKSSQNLFFGQELGILRRKNDNLEKEAKKLRKEKNDLKEDATKWREAKKKLDAEEVSKKAELTRIKQELQLALSKVVHLQDELEKEKKNAQNVIKRRENGMKDMQTQTEEEIEALCEDSAHMRLLRDAKKAADDVLK